MGFVRISNLWPSVFAASSKSAVEACPEKSRTLQSGQSFLTRIANSIPVITGINTSVSRRSGALSLAASNASDGMLNETASMPVLRRIIAIVEQIAFSSSTTKTRNLRWA